MLRALRTRVGALAVVFTAALVVTAVALGAVQTDGYSYTAGQTVQITGDTMSVGEQVTLDVTYPDGSLAQEDIVAADESGNFGDSYTIKDTDPAGVYTVTATGQESGNVYTTTFDPAPDDVSVSLTLTPGGSGAGAGNAYYGDTLKFAGSVLDTTHNTTTVDKGSIVVKQSNERKANICANPDFAAKKLDIYTHGITTGAYDSGFMSPYLSVFPTNSITNGFYALVNSLGAPTPTAYVSSVGDYAFQASYAGGGGDFKSEDSDCEQISVIQAPTATTSQTTDNAGSAITEIGTNVAFYVPWTVTSAYGVSGNTAAGAVTLTQTQTDGTTVTTGLCDGGDNIGLNAVSKTMTKSETTGSGFSYSADASTNTSNRFTCTPTVVGTYKVYVTFTDNSDTASPNPDGNYGNSSSTPSQFTVNAGTLSVCKAAPAIAADYLKTNNIKINSPKYTNIVQEIADEMAKLTRAQFPTYTYTKGSKTAPTAGALLRPCSDAATYASSVQAKTQYYIDTQRS